MPVCNSPTHAWVSAAVPGTKSKCSCTTLFIPVQPIVPSVTVAKGCDVGSDTTPHGSCDAGPEGQPVTYTVTINNTTPSGEGGIVVDQICDNRYGQIFPASGTCTAGTVGSITTTTCGALTVANGGSGSCTFTVAHGENLKVVDTVTVSGHSSLSATTTFGPTSSGTVTVTSEDAPTTVTTNKGLEPGPIAACVTVRYDVTVTNSSGADESVMLNSSSSPTFTPALNDNNYGDITSTHGSASVGQSVTGTTCGVAVGSHGLGTLSDDVVVSQSTTPGTGQAPGGAFPQTINSGGGTYKCRFDGTICGKPGPIPPPPATATCAFGLSQSDTVTANLTGDDANPADVIQQTANQFTANVCLTQQ